MTVACVDLVQLVEDAGWAESDALVIWVQADIARLGTTPLRSIPFDATQAEVDAALSNVEDSLTCWIADFAYTNLTRPAKELRDSVRSARNSLPS